MPPKYPIPLPPYPAPPPLSQPFVPPVPGPLSFGKPLLFAVIIPFDSIVKFIVVILIFPRIVPFSIMILVALIEKLPFN